MSQANLPRVKFKATECPNCKSMLSRVFGTKHFFTLGETHRNHICLKCGEKFVSIEDLAK